MKRLMALLVCVLLLITCILPVSAAETATLTMKAEESCAPGSTVTLTFGVKKGSNIAAANFEVTYDTDTFQYVSHENGDLVAQSMAVGNLKDGKFLFALAGMTPITEAGALFSVTFVVDAEAKGDHLFYFYTTSCCDLDFKTIKTNTKSVKMTVEGDAVSKVSVKPVTSKDADGKKHTVSADNGESATGMLVSSLQNGGGNKTSGKNKSIGLVFTGVIILLVAGVVFLILSAVARAKKNDGNEPELESILDDEGKQMLNLTESEPESDDSDIEQL
jgi:hypothetical protein